MIFVRLLLVHVLILINLSWGNDKLNSIIHLFIIYFRQYLYGGVKIIHGDDPSLLTRWNPTVQTNTHIFVSHHLAYNDKERETIYYNCDEFIQSLDMGKIFYFKKKIFICFSGFQL